MPSLPRFENLRNLTKPTISSPPPVLINENQELRLCVDKLEKTVAELVERVSQEGSRGSSHSQALPPLRTPEISFSQGRFTPELRSMLLDRQQQITLISPNEQPSPIYHPIGGELMAFKFPPISRDLQFSPIWNQPRAGGSGHSPMEVDGDMNRYIQNPLPSPPPPQPDAPRPNANVSLSRQASTTPNMTLADIPVPSDEVLPQASDEELPHSTHPIPVEEALGGGWNFPE